MTSITSILGALSPIFSQIFGNSYSSQLGTVPGLPSPYTQLGVPQTIYQNPQVQTGWYGNGTVATGQSVYNPYYQGAGYPTTGQYSSTYPYQNTPPFVGGYYPTYPGAGSTTGAGLSNPLYQNFYSVAAADFALTRIYGFTKDPANANVYISRAGQRFMLQVSPSVYGNIQQVSVVPYTGTTTTTNPLEIQQLTAQLQAVTEFSSPNNLTANSALGILSRAGYDYVATVPSAAALADAPATYLVKNRTTGQTIQFSEGGYRAPNSAIVSNVTATTVANSNTALQSALNGVSRQDANTLLLALGFGIVNNIQAGNGLITYSHADGRQVTFTDASTATSYTGISNVNVTGGATSTTTDDAALRARLVGQSYANAASILTNQLGFQASIPTSSWSPPTFKAPDGRTLSLITNSYGYVSDIRLTGSTTTTGTLPANLAGGINLVTNGIVAAQQQLDATMSGLGYTLISTASSDLNGRQYRGVDGRVFQTQVDTSSGYNVHVALTDVTSATTTADLPAELSQGLSFPDYPYNPAQSQLHQRMQQLGYQIQGGYNNYSYVKNGHTYVATRVVQAYQTNVYPTQATYTFRDVTSSTGVTGSFPAVIANGFQVLTGGFVPAQASAYVPQGFTRLTFNSNDTYTIVENSSGRQFNLQLASVNHPYTNYTVSEVAGGSVTPPISGVILSGGFNDVYGYLVRQNNGYMPTQRTVTVPVGNPTAGGSTTTTQTIYTAGGVDYTIDTPTANSVYTLRRYTVNPQSVY